MKILLVIILSFILQSSISSILYVAMAEEVTEEDRAEAEEEKREKELESKNRKIKQALKNLGSRNYITFESSVYYFERMKGKAIPYLLPILRDKDEEKFLRINTIYILGRIGPDAKIAIPVIISFLREEDNDFKAVSVIALGKIGHDAKDAVPALRRMLFDKDKWVRNSVVEALGRIGTEEAKLAVKKYFKITKVKKK